MKIVEKFARSKNSRKSSVKKTKIEFLHDCLLIDDCILVLGDLHIGYEEHIAEKGIFPRVQYKEIIEKLNGIFWNLSMKGVKIKQVVILGDLKHEFGIISDVEWGETLRFLDYLDEKIVKNIDRNNIINIKNKRDREGKLSEGSEESIDAKENNRIILVRGNHDNIIGPIARKRDVKLVDFYKYKDICFMHGHKLHGKCFERSKVLMLGHLHPAITLSDKYKKEKYKCFLYGKWKKKQVYVIPSFSPISFGFDLNSIGENKHDEGFLIVPAAELIKNFDVIIYNNKENKEYNFGRLKKLVR